jgi:hypothetical protein
MKQKISREGRKVSQGTRTKSLQTTQLKDRSMIPLIPPLAPLATFARENLSENTVVLEQFLSRRCSFSLYNPPVPTLHISIARQTLTLHPDARDDKSTPAREFPISTSRFGIGTEPGSYKTPLGNFSIGKKIGDNAPLGAVFKSRIPTGQIGAANDPGDLIQTRILWLEGLDQENANTRDRYIYIHGTNHEDAIGTPDSHGCIRMRNADVAALYDLVPEGTAVRIHP